MLVLLYGGFLPFHLILQLSISAWSFFWKLGSSLIWYCFIMVWDSCWSLKRSNKIPRFQYLEKSTIRRLIIWNKMVLRAQSQYCCWACYYISYMKDLFSGSWNTFCLKQSLASRRALYSLNEDGQALAAWEDKSLVPKDHDHVASIQSWNPRDFFP